MIDYVIRRCGFHEWLPIILDTDSGKELYRGDRLDSPEEALAKAKEVFALGQTGYIVEFKRAHGLSKGLA